MTKTRYGIAEWYGQPFMDLSSEHRWRLARIALEEEYEIPPCPYQTDRPSCQKRGGVCSLQRYRINEDGRLGASEGSPVIVCPARFDEGQLLIRWLAEIVGFPSRETMLAREVPFMRGTETSKSAGKIDIVVARTIDGSIDWYGLEVQAVYFSGSGMSSEFGNLRDDVDPVPPFPNAVRRPDWRSSGAKRLMPQLQIKVPTVRRWGVQNGRCRGSAVLRIDRRSRANLQAGILATATSSGWCRICREAIRGHYHLERGHWEVLTLEQSNAKLLAAETVQREEFKAVLRNKLESVAWSNR